MVLRFTINLYQDSSRSVLSHDSLWVVLDHSQHFLLTLQLYTMKRNQKHSSERMNVNQTFFTEQCH